MALYEVKSRITKENIKDALDKLNQTKDFTDQLSPLYSCGIIFIDLKEVDVNKKSIIETFINGKNVFKFSGGMVLRYEGDSTCTGKINLFPRNKEEEVINEKLIPLAKPMDELDIYNTEEGNLQISEQGAGIKLVKTGENQWAVSKLYGVIYNEDSFSVHLSWSKSHFSEFCIELLSSLEGLAYNDKNRPSFGQIFDTIKKKNALIQSPNQEEGKPFLKLKLYEGDEPSERTQIKQDGAAGIITFSILVENWGEYDVITSNDSSKNKLELPKKKFALITTSYQVQLKDESKNLIETLEKENVGIPYRLVYYEDKSTKEFFAIQKELVFKDGNLIMI